MENKYTYLLINILTLAYPLAQSFEYRLKYYKKWYALFPAIVLTAVIFIIWDILKTYYGVWSFNGEYLIGINIINLPIEEWIFFITVPYSCVFIYEVLNYYIKKDYLFSISANITKILATFLLIIGLINYSKIYTFVMFITLGLFLLYIIFYIKPLWLGRFYLAYFVSLIPFLIVNGFLTYLPVVNYNPEHNLGIRIFSIPIEDTIYSLMLILMNITFYEYLQKKR
jgi:lycopene cyclase domain-containing protein